MRCAVSFLTVIILSIAIGVIALCIIWITENKETCKKGDFRCLSNGKCIKNKAFCNKVVDCPDRSDEAPIFCNDLTTTLDMFSMFEECKNLNNLQEEQILELQNRTDSAGGGVKDEDETEDFAVSEKPDKCIFLGLNNTPPKGIKCIDNKWNGIPWRQFDKDARTISIDASALNTSLLLGQSENETGASGVVEFPLLNKLYIDWNFIESVGDHAFCNMDYVCWFSLSQNSIRNLSPATFCPMNTLRMLKLSGNKLHLTNFQFKDMPMLSILYLDENEITTIPNDTFKPLTNLKMLNLSHNLIKFIDKDAFLFNYNLIELDLTHNQLHQVDPSLFRSQRNLTKLYISHNPLKYLPAELFHPLEKLVSLNIDDFDISRFDVRAFSFTPILDLVYFKRFSYCRFVPGARRCNPPSDGLSSISDMLVGQSRVMVWIVGAVTLLGNISVLANRWARQRGTRSAILNIFVSNLAGADLLMGLYLIILACKDVQFRGIYNFKAYEWGSSWLCSVIGIVAMISSEVSLIILTIMSLERYLVIGGSFSQRQNLNVNLARATMLIIWAFVVILALAPSIQWQGNSAFYGSSGLCFPLHLDEKFPVGWQYTTFVFIGVNSCCLLLITISYSMLFYTVRKTQRRTPILVKNIELASRFFLMVVTDVLCWAPIITLKALVLYGYELPKEIVGWAVIYVLPINSAVNPILYTFSTDDVRQAISSQLQGVARTLGVTEILRTHNHAAVLEMQSGTGNGCTFQDQPLTNTEDTDLTHSILCPGGHNNSSGASSVSGGMAASACQHKVTTCNELALSAEDKAKNKKNASKGKKKYLDLREKQKYLDVHM